MWVPYRIAQDPFPPEIYFLRYAPKSPYPTLTLPPQHIIQNHFRIVSQEGKDLGKSGDGPTSKSQVIRTLKTMVQLYSFCVVGVVFINV